MTTFTIQTFNALILQLQSLKQPAIVAIDGRSASGKTTFATKLSKLLQAPIVHTDDIAWNHSFFDWHQLLIENILKPFKAQQPINWIPQAWKTHQRQGSIEIAKTSLLILEGVSATRREFTEWIDFPIWIETASDIAEKRGLERDGEAGRAFWFEWQAAEQVFLEADHPWQRAKLIVDGTSQLTDNSDFLAFSKPKF